MCVINSCVLAIVHTSFLCLLQLSIREFWCIKCPLHLLALPFFGLSYLTCVPVRIGKLAHGVGKGRSVLVSDLGPVW